MDAPVNPSSPGAAETPLAELVVVNGRLHGARRTVTGPLTLIGRAAGCEVRLNVEDVHPLHAALVHGPDGFILRDLSGEGGVVVNAHPVTPASLKHGDILGVGPFRFRLELTAASGAKAVEAERDALRIQAAAVAAQQTALNEEEIRLNQRRTALEKQEEQLAGRLEERRLRLVELQEQTRQEREALQAARAAASQEQAAIRKELEAARDDAVTAGKQVHKERQRLVELRKRLKRRWLRHWNEKDAALARRDKELAARVGQLERQGENLQRARASLHDDRLRLNGDVELGKRQLREQWQELALTQQQWETCLNREHAERDRRSGELEARASVVEEAEHQWAGRERSARLMLAELHRESAGLENRIRNLREKLAQEEANGARAEAVRVTEPSLAPVVFLPSAPLTAADRAAVLQRVAGDLADQRVRLLEQWQTLLHVQEEWRRGREQALADLEAAGRSLQEREQWVTSQERKLDAVASEHRQRQQSLSQMRYSLENWQSRLTAREAAWESERTALTAEVRSREEAAELQLQRLQDLARRREVQRGKEAEELAAARTRCEDLRRQYIALWQECQQRRAELAQEQRDLAARTLAVEQLRLEVLGKAVHSARAERRLERLRRRIAARIKTAEREIEATRLGLNDESDRLNELASDLKLRQDEFAVHREELAREQVGWEERQVAAEDAEQRRRLEWQWMQTRGERDGQLIAHLRDEVERVAGLLIEQADPATQAA